jgi:hypothetical protein
MTADDFREIALSMQDAEERSHMGHPDFRANGRIFSTLGPRRAARVPAAAPPDVRAIERRLGEAGMYYGPPRGCRQGDRPRRDAPGLAARHRTTAGARALVQAQNEVEK